GMFDCLGQNEAREDRPGPHRCQGPSGSVVVSADAARARHGEGAKAAIGALCAGAADRDAARALPAGEPGAAAWRIGLTRAAERRAVAVAVVRGDEIPGVLGVPIDATRDVDVDVDGRVLLRPGCVADVHLVAP